MNYNSILKVTVLIIVTIWMVLGPNCCGVWSHLYFNSQSDYEATPLIISNGYDECCDGPGGPLWTHIWNSARLASVFRKVCVCVCVCVHHVFILPTPCVLRHEGEPNNGFSLPH